MDNIVNYYEPVLDESGKISDFKIVYANECNREYLGLDPEKIIGRKISEVFPFLFLNGEFEGLVKCLAQNEKVILHRQIEVGGKKMWFKSIVKPLSGGVSVTARNTTPEKSTEESLRAMNEELKAGNLELSDTGDFLNELLASTPAIITYLEPVADGTGGTTDFEIIFASRAAEDLANVPTGETVGGNLSEIYPDFMENGIYSLLSRCMETAELQTLAVKVRKDKGVMSSFRATASRTGSGVTLTLNPSLVRRAD